MGVGRRTGEALDPLDFENFSKKGCFLSFEWKKSNFTTFGPALENVWKNPLAPSLEKILPTPMINTITVILRSP